MNSQEGLFRASGKPFDNAGLATGVVPVMVDRFLYTVVHSFVLFFNILCSIL